MFAPQPVPVKTEPCIKTEPDDDSEYQTEGTEHGDWESDSEDSCWEELDALGLLPLNSFIHINPIVRPPWLVLQEYMMAIAKEHNGYIWPFRHAMSEFHGNIVNFECVTFDGVALFLRYFTFQVLEFYCIFIYIYIYDYY